MLLWIGIKLVTNQEEESEVSSSSSLWRTAVTITVADVIMSLDNVLAVAAAGKGHLLLVALGVLISIPIIVLGSKLVLAILNRFPSVVMLGGALIGWIAGSMMVTDVTIVHLFPNAPAALPLMGGTIGAALVLLEGLRRKPQALHRIGILSIGRRQSRRRQVCATFPPHPPSFALSLIKTPDPGSVTVILRINEITPWN